MSFVILPPEILDNIFSFIVEETPSASCTRPQAQLSKIPLTILDCALVSRAWLPLARRHLLSTHFPQGRIRIQPIPLELIRLIDILHSPLSTLRPDALRTLCVDPKVVVRDTWCWDENSDMEDSSEFFSALVDLNCGVLPSLETLIFDGINPQTGVEYDERFSTPCPPPTSILSQIKYLEIYNPWGTSWEDNVHAIRFCEGLEELKVRGKRYVSAALLSSALVPLYREFPLPSSLHTLDLDMTSLVQTIPWLQNPEPCRPRISSCSIHGATFLDYIASPELRLFFDTIGQDLHDLELHLASTHSSFNASTGIKHDLEYHADLYPLCKTPVLRQVMVKGNYQHVLQALVTLFENKEFAPLLELLEITATNVHALDSSQTVYGLHALGDNLRSRPLIRQIIVRCEGESCDGSKHVLDDSARDTAFATLKEVLMKCDAAEMVTFASG